MDVERPCPSTTYFENIGNIKTMSNASLSKKQREEILKALKARFEKNMNRHKGLEWAEVQAKLEANADKLWSLNEMGQSLDIAFAPNRAHPIFALIWEQLGLIFPGH
jgi:hypothetical protein